MKEESERKLLVLAREIATRTRKRYGNLAVISRDPELLDWVEYMQKHDRKGILSSIIKKIERNAHLMTIDELYYDSDPLTQVGLISPYAHDTRELGSVWENISPGKLLAITGLPGTGKTYAAMCLARYALSSGWVVFSNVLAREKPKRYVQIHSMRELLESTIQHWDRRKMILLDETGVFATTAIGHGSSKNIFHLTSLIKLSRKFDMAFIWIDQQSKGSIPPFLLKMALEGAGILEMERKGRGVYITPGGEERVYVLPDAIPYDTRSMASLRFNINVELLLSRLSGLAYEEVPKALELYLSGD